MNVTELRVGSIINIGKEVIIIELCDFVDIFYQKDTLKSYEPILITEEWLLKLGFKKYNYIKGLEEVVTGYLLDELLLTYFDAKHSLNGEGYFISLNNEKSILNRLPLKYVHQLQNLHFLLTGNELKYKD